MNETKEIEIKIKKLRRAVITLKDHLHENKGSLSILKAQIDYLEKSIHEKEVILTLIKNEQAEKLKE